MSSLSPDPPAAQAAISDDGVWIRESFVIAQQYAYVAPVGDGAGPYTLGQTYQTKAREHAELRVELAGVRLANLINANLR